MLDAVRLGPDDDETEVTAAQVRDVVTRLIAAGHWREGDLRILVVFDAGYDVTRLAWLLADLPVDLLGRLRADRVMQLPAPPRPPGTNGRPRKHGSGAGAGRPGNLAGPAGHHEHADLPVWHRPDRRLGPGAPPADAPRGLARSRRRPAGHRGHRDPAAPSITCPATGTPSRYGCGGHAPAPRPPGWTGAGSRSCAASTWSTHSGCSSRSWGGPRRRSATPRPRTGGPG